MKNKLEPILVGNMVYNSQAIKELINQPLASIRDCLDDKPAFQKSVEDAMFLLSILSDMVEQNIQQLPKQ